MTRSGRGGLFGEGGGVGIGDCLGEVVGDGGGEGGGEVTMLIVCLDCD